MPEKSGVSLATISHFEQGVNQNMTLNNFISLLRIIGMEQRVSDLLPNHWGNMVFNKWAKTHYSNFRSVNIPVLQHKNSKAIEKHSIYCLLKTNIVLFAYDFE